MTEPFIRKGGIVFVDRRLDTAIRKWLVDIAPLGIQPKIRAALSGYPAIDALEQTKKYFGDELQFITPRISHLANKIDLFMAGKLKIPGFLDWLNETNYGNDLAMIKAFIEWADRAGSAINGRQ